MHVGPVHLNPVTDGLGKKRIAWCLSFLIPRFTIRVTLYNCTRKFY